MTVPNSLHAVLLFLRRNIIDALGVCAALFKIMIPVMILMKILQELGLVAELGHYMAPLMQLFGLPGSVGLVWATALLTNLYAAAIVLITLLPETPLTSAQVTVIATMMLIAHGLPVELSIARRSGARIRTQFLIRMIAAMLCGWLLYMIYAGLNWGTGFVQPAWIPDAPPSGLPAWVLREIRNLAGIATIVLVMLMLLDILKRLGITDLMIRLLSPVFNSMGIGREAGTITIVGVTLGLSYGGGLIIHEARSGRIPAKDVFLALTFMGLCHALIEDTLLMLLLGADLGGILLARMAFSLAFLWVLSRIVARLSESTINGLLFRQDAVQRKPPPFFSV
ncbi:Nucleoside recognition [Desulfonatronum thiosulfatophilum]|uniref:Nucleoside recognition n=1 Tax=Desulfonatronum thiosulfatophilum TaxID=617002 RepID=A0A1G6DQ43_9BACT|nr:nucleoside recognition domain-containing protein [Desulfonatronum thiosulfatophilum]SDB47241.1 Nucleoside recognition [Desulfonatronum thiosulfatophilum]